MGQAMTTEIGAWLRQAYTTVLGSGIFAYQGWWSTRRLEEATVYCLEVRDGTEAEQETFDEPLICTQMGSLQSRKRTNQIYSAQRRYVDQRTDWEVPGATGA